MEVVLKKINIYIYHQTGYFLFLFLVFILPLVLFLQFSPYPFQKIEYFVFGSLFLFQYVMYSEQKYRKQIEPKIRERLCRELGRTPSKKEVHRRANFLVVCRGGTIIWTALEILVVMYYFT